MHSVYTYKCGYFRISGPSSLFRGAKFVLKRVSIIIRVRFIRYSSPANKWPVGRAVVSTRCRRTNLTHEYNVTTAVLRVFMRELRYTVVAGVHPRVTGGGWGGRRGGKEYEGWWFWCIGVCGVHSGVRSLKKKFSSELGNGNP